MKRVLIVLAAFCALTAPVSSAAPGHGRGHHKSAGLDDVPPGLANKPYGMLPGQAKKMWRKGERIPNVYIVPQYFIPYFFFQAEDGIRDHCVTGVQTCALPI